MPIPFQFNVQTRFTGFERCWQSSLGVLVNVQYTPELQPVGRISLKNSLLRCLRKRIYCHRGASLVDANDEIVIQKVDQIAEQLSIVMKFGCSSIATAERMREVIKLIQSFPDDQPVIVLSAMGETADKLLQAGENAVRCGLSNVSGIHELIFIKYLHLKAVNGLGLDKFIISDLLEGLKQLLKGIAVTKELMLHTRDYLATFGDCISTRILAAYLNKLGTKAHQVLHPQSMRRARESGIPVRIKNSYNPEAQVALITTHRDMSMSKALLTCIALKPSIAMMDIVSIRMLDRYGFLAKVFSILEEWGISVDCVATSEGSISLTLDPFQLWSKENVQQELDHVVKELEKIAVVRVLHNRSLISLIGNAHHSSLVMETAFSVLSKMGVNIQMISQGASKVNISMVVHNIEAKECVRALNSAFFENTDVYSHESDLECSFSNSSSMLRTTN